jgi:hypothetical protein
VKPIKGQAEPDQIKFSWDFVEDSPDLEIKIKFEEPEKISVTEVPDQLEIRINA